MTVFEKMISRAAIMTAIFFAAIIIRVLIG